MSLFLSFHIIDAQFVYETRARLMTLDNEILCDPDANSLYVSGPLFVIQFKGRN